MIRNKNGFSLIELLVTIVIMGIIASFSVVFVGQIITNTKQKGDVAVTSSLNEATTLMKYGSGNLNSNVFGGYDTDAEKLTYMVNQGYFSKYPVPMIDTNEYSFDADLQLWVLLGSGGSVTFAETNEDYFTISGSKITGYDEVLGGLSVVVPQQINGTAITELGQDSFRGVGITSIIIQEGITRISGNSLHSNNLTTISFPDSVTRIWHNACYGNQLTSVTFGSGLTRIEAGAFSDNSITSLNLPSSLEYVGDGAFGYGDNYITLITIGSDVTIGNAASFGRYGSTFKSLYDVNKEAGTYQYFGGTWTKQ